MRFVVLLLFVICASTVVAQSSPEWSRVYTFDDSTIEMNTSLITPIDKDINRLRFRWTFDNLQLSDGVRYQSQIEVMEFNCSANKYRSYHLTFLDKAGNIVRVQDSPGEWRSVSGPMMEKLFVPGCNLIKAKNRPVTQPDESPQLEKAARFAHDFAQQLEQTKDFKIVIDRFFVAEYLNGYLHDEQTNWFSNLSRDTATKATHQELERYYVALLNAGYLTSLYLISEVRSDAPSMDKAIPPDVRQLIDNHPYTLRYQKQKGDYEFLSETIDDLERLRSSTDLLERIGSLMRAHVRAVNAERNPNWKAMFEDESLYQPKVAVCAKNCLGLSKGTKIYEVDIPVFHLQIAEIDGKLKVISAKSR
jgi:hypothetical protein